MYRRNAYAHSIVVHTEIWVYIYLYTHASMYSPSCHFIHNCVFHQRRPNFSNVSFSASAPRAPLSPIGPSFYLSTTHKNQQKKKTKKCPQAGVSLRYNICNSKVEPGLHANFSVPNLCCFFLSLFFFTCFLCVCVNQQKMPSGFETRTIC
ncbi:hypothetical protein V8C42DRAFT_186740 [Trichoderma barbatum]